MWIIFDKFYSSPEKMLEKYFVAVENSGDEVS